MKYSILLLALVGLCGFTAAAQTAAEKELLEIENEWIAANNKHDYGFLERILAPEFVYINSKGLLENREQAIAGIKKANIDFTALIPSDMKAVVCGETGLVTGRVTVDAKKSKSHRTEIATWIDVFARREGKWYCVTMWMKDVTK